METIISLTFGQILGGITIGLLSLGVAQWLFMRAITTTIETSIKHQYDKQIEEYKYLISKREKVANIATFFSHWIKYRGNEQALLNDRELTDYYEALNRMSFELTLWIEDDVILKDIMKRLRNEDGSAHTIDLLLTTKTLLTQKPTDLTRKDITLWPPDPSVFKNMRRFSDADHLTK